MNGRFVSLFSGCGGLDLGFIQAGLSCVAAFDIDKDAIATYTRNIGNHIHYADLNNPVPEVLAAALSADILVAGPPCQGFSTAGKNDPADTRNSLLLKVAEIAAIARPKVVVIENVRGLLSPRYQPYWTALLERLSSVGYSVTSKVVEATEFGVPQSRRRVIVLGVLNHPNGSINLSLPKAKAITLKTALTGIHEAKQHIIRPLPQDSHALKIARCIRPGQKLSNVRGGENSVHTWHIPEVFGHIENNEKQILETLLQVRRQKRRRNIGDADPVSIRDLSDALGFSPNNLLPKLIKNGYVRKIGKYYDLTNAFNGKFRRLQWDEPAPTVDTRFGQPRYFLHPDENRGFSVREAARIQGFPDDFCFAGAESVAYRLIGNAVPPPMAKSIAKFIIDSF